MKKKRATNGRAVKAEMSPATAMLAIKSAVDSIEAVCLVAGMPFAILIQPADGYVFTVGNVPEGSCVMMLEVAKLARHQEENQ